MNNFERLEDEYPQLKIRKITLPSGQGGFIYDDQIFISKDHDYSEQYCILAEEIGHYETTSGNVIAQDTWDKRKQERKARKWGCFKLITLDGLIDCYKNSITNISDISDYFGVTPKYLIDSFEFLEEKYGQQFTYNSYQFDFSHGLNIEKKQKETI